LQTSWQAAIDFAKKEGFTHYLAVGGGSVIDTCKVAFQLCQLLLLVPECVNI
jgi:alcohol dehydrogenase YqhD (iron-dependent ADH family)